MSSAPEPTSELLERAPTARPDRAHAVPVPAGVPRRARTNNGPTPWAGVMCAVFVIMSYVAAPGRCNPETGELDGREYRTLDAIKARIRRDNAEAARQAATKHTAPLLPVRPTSRPSPHTKGGQRAAQD